MSVVLAGLSGVTFGVADFIGGIASRRAPALLVVFWGQVVGLAMVALAAPVFGGALSPPALTWGAGAGLFGAAGVIALYHGFAVGRVAVVAPTSAVMAAALPVAMGVIGGERPSPTAWLGIVLAIPAILLVSSGNAGGEAGSGLPFGVLAGLGFGLFFVLIGGVPDDSGLWPLVPARVGGLAMMAAVVAVGRSGFELGRPARLGAVAAGVGDMAANILFLAATRTGLLSLAAVLSSLYPAVSVILARLVIAERITGRQWAGLGLATAAVAAIAA